MKPFPNTLLFVVLALSIDQSPAQTILLFSNDFSAPLLAPVANCGPDLDATSVNDLWGGTGTGTGGGGLWAQINTVETILLNGPDNIYTDSAGIGGDYCLGMLSTFQDDRAALTLDRDTLPFVNFVMDISALDMPACGGPFGLAQPVVRVLVYDSPGGVFDIQNPGIPLDEDTLTGAQPWPDPYTTSWATVATGLDVSQATDGNVSVVIDLLASGYAVFDNIEITASVSQVGMHEVHSPKPLRTYPNPAGDLLWLDVPAGAYQWTVLAMNGMELRSGSASAAHPVDISALPSGAYVLRVIGRSETRVARFMKQ